MAKMINSWWNWWNRHALFQLYKFFVVVNMCFAQLISYPSRTKTWFFVYERLGGGSCSDEDCDYDSDGDHEHIIQHIARNRSVTYSHKNFISFRQKFRSARDRPMTPNYLLCLALHKLSNGIHFCKMIKALVKNLWFIAWEDEFTVGSALKRR